MEVSYMKAKLLMMGVMVVISAMLASELSPAATQGSASASNANQRSARRSKGKANAGRASHRSTTEAASSAETAQAAQPRSKRAGRRKGAKAMRGVPHGVSACIEHLLEMAKAGEPYEGHPREIINNGLLWNNPKSHCAVTDQSLRKKISDAATYWQLKQMDKVISLLEEVKSALPASAAKTPGRERQDRGD
jgi:cobalamin biosynthesis Mg chelatase CobN